MPRWEDYKATARDRGALALELFVVNTTPVDPARLPDVLPAHLEYQKQMEAAGKLVMAGPVSDETGDQMEGAGMIIYRAPDLERARAIADADPMHAEGVRSYTIRKWLVNEGSLSFTIALSGQVVTFA